jgi:hypothetical protein
LEQPQQGRSPSGSPATAPGGSFRADSPAASASPDHSGSSVATPSPSAQHTGSAVPSGSMSPSSSGSSVAPDPAPPTAEPPRLRTRLQHGIEKPKIITDGRVRYDRLRFANLCASGEPSSVQ